MAAAPALIPHFSSAPEDPIQHRLTRRPRTLATLRGRYAAQRFLDVPAAAGPRRLAAFRALNALAHDRDYFPPMALNGVVSVPMPSMSIVTTSPGFRNSLRSMPVPEGVPVEIKSPG